VLGVFGWVFFPAALQVMNVLKMLVEVL